MSPFQAENGLQMLVLAQCLVLALCFLRRACGSTRATNNHAKPIFNFNNRCLLMQQHTEFQAKSSCTFERTLNVAKCMCVLSEHFVSEVLAFHWWS